jgi:membrane-bound metal-dependent hydrolase YbcI (DUF457 family)
LDNLTHSLVGWTLARAGLGRRVPYATATLIVASNIPDIDILTALTGGGVGYLAAHRGPTHGPVGIVGLGILSALLVYAWTAWRGRGAPGTPAWRQLPPLCALGVAATTLHVLMDLPTSYGTRILSPFVGTWYALDWMPIIDVLLWTILAAALIAGVRPAWRTRAARIALVLMLADYSARGLLHERALDAAATRRADATVSACAARPTLVRHPALIEARLAGPGACIQAAALPTFLSPFRWRAIRQYPNGYELSERSVLRPGAHVQSAWMPADVGPEIARARATRTGRVFLDFSRFPSSHVVARGPDEVVVRIVDVRFVGPALRLDDNLRARSPFVATIAIDGGGRIVREQLGN